MRTQLRKLHRMLPTAIVIAGLAAPRPGLAADTAAATAAPAGSPRIGLALSGGGARGIAHIGVLKVLEETAHPDPLRDRHQHGMRSSAARSPPD